MKNKTRHTLSLIPIQTELHMCAKSVQFYLTKELIINTKVYDKKLLRKCAIPVFHDVPGYVRGYQQRG